MAPAVHHPQGEQVRNSPGADRGRRLRGEIAGGQPAQLRQPFGGHLAELVEHRGAGHRPPRVDTNLVRPAHLILHVGQRARLVPGRGPAECARLVVHQVRDLVLDRPSRAPGRQVPLAGGQV